jgi:hypothetical protein
MVLTAVTTNTHRLDSLDGAHHNSRAQISIEAWIDLAALLSGTQAC